MGLSDPSVPSAPDPAKSYQAGIDVFLKNLPTLLSTEDSTRAAEDPQRIAAQQALQSYFGPIQTQQQLDQLQQIDPTGQDLRKQLGGVVSGDLGSGGYGLPAEYSKELDNQIRGAQVARGGGLGNAPISAEAVYKGKAAIDLHNQNIANAGQFLGLQTPEQQATLLTPITPDRSFAYASPTAGLSGQNFALNNYQNLLAQNQLSQGNAWTSALSGAAQGAAAGGSVGGGWGALIGGAAGGVAGGLGYG